MKFIDKVRIFVKAGRGGDGCLSFLREKYREFGGPDGADGGKGGDVYLEADRNVGTLLDFSHNPHLTAGDGGHGKGKNKTGPSAEDRTVRVPVGTVVFKDGRLLKDLAASGDRVLAARGGRGGRGNQSFKSRHNTAPRLCERGEPGEEAALELELKLIADAGLVGFPNAGKSTLLARVSKARPKIAAYPFTTLSPHLGMVKHKERSFVMADIPGLIEGASAGKGLGDDFLRHVERTRVLIHLVDPMGFDGVPAADGIRKIEAELKGYARDLALKPKILALNKTDLPDAEPVLRAIRSRFRSRRVFGISAATGEGVSEMLDAVLKELNAGPAGPIVFESRRTGREVVMEKGFRVARAGGGVFRVVGAYVERAAAMADLGLMESVYRLQRTLRKIGVDKALRNAGIREGELVAIGDKEFEWSDEAVKAPPRLPRRRRVK